MGMKDKLVRAKGLSMNGRMDETDIMRMECAERKTG